MRIRRGTNGSSRLRIAAVTFGIMLAAALFGLAPAAGASTAGLQAQHSASQSAGTVTPEVVQGPINGGSYGTLDQCNSALNEFKTNPNYAGGYCVLQNGKWVCYYYVYVSACVVTGTDPAPGGTARLPGGAAPAAC